MADDVKRLLLITYAGQVDNNVVSLTCDLWLRNSKRVYTLTNDVNGLRKRTGCEFAFWLQRDRCATLQVEPEGWHVASQKVASQYSRSGNNAAATQVMRQGYEQFGKAPQLVPEVIRYQRLSGDAKGASDAAIACTLDYPEYADDCVKAANPT